MYSLPIYISIVYSQPWNFRETFYKWLTKMLSEACRWLNSPKTSSHHWWRSQFQRLSGKQVLLRWVPVFLLNKTSFSHSYELPHTLKVSGALYGLNEHMNPSSLKSRFTATAPSCLILVWEHPWSIFLSILLSLHIFPLITTTLSNLFKWKVSLLIAGGLG